MCPKNLSPRLTAMSLAVVALCSVGSTQVVGVAKGRLLVKFTEGTTAPRVNSVISSVGAHQIAQIPGIGVRVLQLPLQANEAAVAEALARKANVLFAQPDFIVRPESNPTDPHFGSQWHLGKIAAPTAWNTVLGSSSVIVAILDTGCDPTHPDLSSKYVNGWNFYDNNADWSDVYGHGTAVAGSAAAATNNGLGVAGVAWNTMIMPIRVSDLTGYALSSTMATGLVYAADHGARVANLSYRMSTYSSVKSAAQYFMNHGGVVTISAGNEATFDPSPDNPYAITVGATTSTDTLASWSNTGNLIDVVAPGVGIYTTNRGGTYGSWSGTSFSAPITAGLAALVISANPSLTGAQVQQIVLDSVDDLGPAGWDTTFGWGRVNAYKAVSLAVNGGSTTDTQPPTVSFSNPTQGGVVSGSVAVQIAASDNTGVSSVAISLDGVQVLNLTTSPYTWTWNSANSVNGVHNITATALDGWGNASTKTISVTVNNVTDTIAPTAQVTSPSGGSHVGNTMTVAASASDNVGVSKVELWVDGALKATDTSAPYSFSYNSRKWTTGSSHSVQVKAYDSANNVGPSSMVSVMK